MSRYTDSLIDELRLNLLEWKQDQAAWDKQKQGRYSLSDVGHHMCWLFNTETYADLVTYIEIDKDSLEAIEKLCGPNGYAYYKMMVIRRLDAEC